MSYNTLWAAYNFGITAMSNAATAYLGTFNCQISSSGAQTDANLYKVYPQLAYALSQLTGGVGTNSYTSTATVASYINGATGNQLISFQSLGSNVYVTDSTHGDSPSANQPVCLQSSFASASFQIVPFFLGMTANCATAATQYTTASFIARTSSTGPQAMLFGDGQANVGLSGDSSIQHYMGSAGVSSLFTVYNNNTNTSCTPTTVKNGATGNQTVTISGIPAVGTDTTHTDSYSVGDTSYLNNSNSWNSFTQTFTSSGTAMDTGTSAMAGQNSKNCMIPFTGTGGSIFSFSSVDQSTQEYIPVAMTASKLRQRANGATTGSAVSRINGTNGNQTISFTTTQAWNVDSTHTDSLAAGAKLNASITNSGHYQTAITLDAGSASNNYNGSVAEVGAAAETLSSRAAFGMALGEAGNAQDTDNIFQTGLSILVEAGNAVDAVNNLSAYLATIVEAPVVQDILNGGYFYSVSLAENLFANEDFVGVQTGFAGAGPPGCRIVFVLPEDRAVALWPLELRIVFSHDRGGTGPCDPPAQGQPIPPPNLYSVSIIEIGNALDFVSAAGTAPSIYHVLIAEAGIATDVPSSVYAANATLTEIGTLADLIGYPGAYSASLVDTGVLADSASAKGLFLGAIAEAGSASDSLSGTVTHGNIITVGTPSGLQAAMVAANPGDIIELTSGSYGDLSFALPAKSAPGIYVRPQAGATVSIGTWSIDSWTGVTIESNGSTRISMFAAGVSNSTNITLDSIDFSNDPTTYQTVGGWTIAYRTVTNFTINNCTSKYTGNSVTGIGANGLTITNNTFEYTSDDLVHLGADLTNFTFSGNLLTLSVVPGLLHADALQIFGATGTTLTNLTIINNKIIRGVGGQPVQGIFLQSDGVTSDGLLIQGNMIMSGNWWGVGVSGPWSNVTVNNNYIGGYTDAVDPGSGQVMTPWIRIDTVDTLTVTNNITVAGFIDMGGSTNETISNNTTIALAAPDDLTAANAWWAANH